MSNFFCTLKTKGTPSSKHSYTYLVRANSLDKAKELFLKEFDLTSYEPSSVVITILNIHAYLSDKPIKQVYLDE